MPSKLIILLFLLSSNISFSQNHHDSLTFSYLDSVWRKAHFSQQYPIINLDSNELDLYKLTFPASKNKLRMKFGYVRDSKAIYCFEIISSDLQTFLSDTAIHSKPLSYPENVFFKLCYVFNGTTLKCYKTHERRSGSTEEFNLFWEPRVDRSFKGFNMPFIVRDEVKYRIRKWDE
jgi:hypothetical protein